MTETCALGAINRGDEYLAKPNSSGLNVPYLTEVAVTDENWNFLNSGEVGEIVFKSPTNTIGYLKNNEETEKARTAKFFTRQGDEKSKGCCVAV